MEFVLSAFADEAGQTLAEQIEACRENGIRHIELRGINGGNAVELTCAQAKDVAAQLKEEGFGVSALGSPFGKIGIEEDFAPHFDQFRHALGIAHILETPNIRMFSFYMHQGKQPRAYKEAVLERLERMAQAAAEAGIHCRHENEKDIYGDTAERCLTILRAFKGKITGIFDFANFVQCGQDTMEAYHLLADYIGYFHIKDALPDGSITPAGKGAGNIRDILLQASQKPGRCFLTLEPHLAVFAGAEKLERERRNFSGYASNREAFHAAASALKELLHSLGYEEEKKEPGCWKKH